MAAPRKRTPELLGRQVPSLINELVWVLAAAVLGFATPGVFSGLLELRRDWFVAIYAVLVGSFLYGYIRWSGGGSQILHAPWLDQPKRNSP